MSGKILAPISSVTLTHFSLFPWPSYVSSICSSIQACGRSIFSPVDRVLVSSSADRTLRLWSVSDYSCLRSFGDIRQCVVCKFMYERHADAFW